MQAEPDSVNLRVPFHAPSASVVRRELRDWLAERGYRGENVDDARVVVSVFFVKRVFELYYVDLI